MGAAMKVFKPLADSVPLTANIATAMPALPFGAVLRVASIGSFRYRFGDSGVTINQGTQGTWADAPVLYVYPLDGATHIAVTADAFLSYGYLL